MRKFLLLALPMLVLTMALFRALQGELGHAPRLARVAGESPWLVIGTWLLEAMALCALYLLIQGGGGGRVMSGLLSGWIAWVFRGPLLVISVATLGGQTPGPWWSLAFSWWILYTLCGLVLGAMAAAADLAPPQRASSSW